MKRVKLLTVLSAVAFLALGLSSCNKDEDKVTILDPVKFSGVISEEDAVDLGLSVNWAGYNVGAEKPEQLGSYFCWGETAVKEEGILYEKDNWIYYDAELTQRLKYSSGDALVVLEAGDDAATAAWGEGFRMPTAAEVEELINGCDWTYAKYKGVTGWVATKKAAKVEEGEELVEEGEEPVEEELPSIFFPVSGFKVNASTQGKDRVIYLSSSLYATNSDYAITISGNDRGIATGSLAVFYGGQIRAVSKKTE